MLLFTCIVIIYMFCYCLHVLLLFICIVIVYRESDITKERVQKILSTGANVVLTTGGIDDLCLKYFVEAGAMAVRRCKKEDLKRIARATGGTCLCTRNSCMVVHVVMYMYMYTTILCTQLSGHVHMVCV